MRRPLIVAALLLAAAVPDASARQIDVTTAADALAADGSCSLREAITSANFDSAPFAGAGECPSGEGGDAIAIPGMHITLTRFGAFEEVNGTGDLDVLGPTTISGAGTAATTIDGDGLFDRVLDIGLAGSVTVQGVTITGGHAPNGSNGLADNKPLVMTGNGAQATGGAGGTGQDGGGIRNAGTLAIEDAAILGNAAGSGGQGGGAQGGSTADPGRFGGLGSGGQGGFGGRGGGIYSTGRLSLTGVLVSGNSAGAGGAGGLGIGGQGGSSGSGGGGSGANGSGGHGGPGGSGGGVHAGANTTIDLSTIRQNHASHGGAGGGGQAGPGGFGLTGGGSGLNGSGGFGGRGGDGGGIFATGVVTRTLVAGNKAGNGGSAGKGVGGNGGQLIGTTGFAGSGGPGSGGDGGLGGSGGGIRGSGQGTLANLTLVENAAGAGGNGGAGEGGKGAAASGSGTGGSGGNGSAGDGGDAGLGGALILFGPPALEHATVTNNSLSGFGTAGAGTAGSGGNGGTPGGTGSVFNGTNGAPASGGAVFGFSQTTLRNSIVAANSAPSCGGTVLNGDHDISFGDATCPGANVDPLLGALADNGGPSLTRRPGAGSPALDAVPGGGAFCPLTDQRGATRPHGGGCEIGAYEMAPPDVAITDAAATVSGSVNPNGRATTYHFEYGTTAGYGSSTAEGSLAAGIEPVAVSAALDALAPGTTYHVRIVATNADGTSASGDAIFTTSAGPGEGGGGTGDTKAPVWQSASINPKTFRVDRRGRAETPVAGVRRGTRFRYGLSEAARVVFTIERRKGRRYVRPRRFAKLSKAGANVKRFRGRIGRRALRPGRYRATLVATDAAGNRSQRKRLLFRVVR